MVFKMPVTIWESLPPKKNSSILFRLVKSRNWGPGRSTRWASLMDQGSLASLQKPTRYKHHQTSSNWKVRRRLMIWTKSARLKKEGLQVFVGILQGNLFWPDFWSFLHNYELVIHFKETPNSPLLPFSMMRIWMSMLSGVPAQWRQMAIDDCHIPKRGSVRWLIVFLNETCPHSGNVSSDVWRMGGSTTVATSPCWDSNLETPLENEPQMSEDPGLAAKTTLPTKMSEGLKKRKTTLNSKQQFLASLLVDSGVYWIIG